MGRLVHIFTDHVNLLNMYEPQGMDDYIPRYSANKLMRWDIRLKFFNYIVEHIPGEINLWADLLSCWANHDHNMVRAERVHIETIMMASISSSLRDEFDWPATSETEKEQPKMPWKRVEPSEQTMG